MSCTRHGRMFEWGHHTWRRRVVDTEYVPTLEVNMWSRPVHSHAVLCNTEWVCTRCGTTTRHEGCICDVDAGEQCPARQACLDTLQHAH